MHDFVKKVFQQIEAKFGVLQRIGTSRSLYNIPSKNIFIYFRYSKVHTAKKIPQAFYGLRKEDIDLIREKKAFICFVWKGKNSPLLLPFSKFEQYICKNPPARDKQYKVSIYFNQKTEFYVQHIEKRIPVDSFYGLNALFAEEEYDEVDEDGMIIPYETEGNGIFGTYETNQQVESAAVKYVTKHYNSHGWKVISVENQKCGYDLVCTKDGDEERNVEVKGVSGKSCSFIITAGEFKQAGDNPKFFICIVTNALSSNPVPFSYSGKEFIEKFSIEPIQYKAKLKS
jgi:hypothetical protein